GSYNPSAGNYNRASRPRYRVGLTLTGRHHHAGPPLAEAFGQFLNREPLRRIMARQDQADALSPGGEVIVEPHLAGEEDVGPGPHGVVEKLAGRPASDRDPLDRSVAGTND